MSNADLHAKIASRVKTRADGERMLRAVKKAMEGLIEEAEREFPCCAQIVRNITISRIDQELSAIRDTIEEAF